MSDRTMVVRGHKPRPVPSLSSSMTGPSPDTGGQRRTLLHKGRKFDFELVEVTSRDGTTHHREVVRHPGAVIILPILEDGRLVLIRNHRFSIPKVLWELPAGTLEPPEVPIACAARELAEETGYQSSNLRPLGRFYTSPGLSDELMWAFWATDLSPVGQNLEVDEDLSVHPVSARQALDMLDSRELCDAKSMVTLLMAQRRGLLVD